MAGKTPTRRTAREVTDKQFVAGDRGWEVQNDLAKRGQRASSRARQRMVTAVQKGNSTYERTWRA